MTYPRSHIVSEGEPGFYHVVSRCVRRAFLCGRDQLTGQDFEHRRQWIEARILGLADCFAVSVYAYAVMSNHVHVVLHVDPSATHQLSDEDIATRWLQAFPGSLKSDAAPERAEVLKLAITGSPERIAELRKRLGSLSWFMKALNEPIARRANREDNCKGKFWESRFKCQALLEAHAVLSCSEIMQRDNVCPGFRYNCVWLQWDHGMASIRIGFVGGDNFCSSLKARQRARLLVDSTTGRRPRTWLRALLCLPILFVLNLAAASEEQTRDFLVEAVDLPYRAGLGSSGFAVLPGLTAGSAERLFEFGSALLPGSLSQIVGVREDGLKRANESLVDGQIDFLQVALIPEPFALFLERQTGGIPSGATFQVRRGPRFAEARSFTLPQTFGLITDLALVDPIDADSFHYAILEPGAVYMMHSAADEPVWVREVEWAESVVSFQPEPNGPTRLAVGTASKILILDPLSGEIVNEWPLSASAGMLAARLSTSGGEQLLVAGFPPQGLRALDTLTGVSLWQVESMSFVSLYARDLDGDGLDEVLIGRWTNSGPLIEWRSGDGSLIDQRNNFPLFRNAAVFDVFGDGVREIILDSREGVSGNRLLSVDLGTVHTLPSAGISPVSDRFHPAMRPQGDLSLVILMRGFGLDPNPGIPQSFLRSIAATSGNLNWLREFATDGTGGAVGVAGFNTPAGGGEAGSLFVLQRSPGSEPFMGSYEIHALDAGTGSTVQMAGIEFGEDSALDLLAVQMGAVQQLLVLSQLDDEVRYHLIDPQTLELTWSSDRFGLSGVDVFVEAVDGQFLLITGSRLSGLRSIVIDLSSGSLFYSTASDLNAVYLFQDADGTFLLVTQDSEYVLGFRDLDTDLVVKEIQLDFPVDSMIHADSGLLLAGNTQVHFLDFVSEAVVCRSDLIRPGAFRAHPTRSDRWFMASGQAVHAMSFVTRSGLFRDRFEVAQPGFCF